jgi:hypothetical protein
MKIQNLKDTQKALLIQESALAISLSYVTYKKGKNEIRKRATIRRTLNAENYQLFEIRN